MGVERLLQQLYKDKVHERVDLIQKAQENPIEILVDLSSFQYYIESKLLKMLKTIRANNYLEILGGEYASVDEYFTNFVHCLSNYNIKLVFFEEKESNGGNFRTKRSRTGQRQKRITNTIEVCRGQKPIEYATEPPRSHLRKLQIIRTINANGWELVPVSGEADSAIVMEYKKRNGEGRYCAIFSNDADFCVFEDCNFISDQLFDLEHDLEDDLDTCFLHGRKTKLDKIIAGVLNSKAIIKHYCVSIK